jgi:tetratricopeptide (TPR) repeat protein
MTESSPRKSNETQKLLARARELADADEYEKALALLHLQRGKLDIVPPAFDAAIGRLSLQAGRADEAVDYLTRAHSSYGDKAPAKIVVMLADALLRAGRVEAAGQALNKLRQSGARISRPAHHAAIDAFSHRATDALDSGPPTPWRILAQAETLADRRERQAAPELLATHRNDWAAVPEQYDAALCRLSLRSGDQNAAVTCLSRAAEGSRGAVPAMIRQALGTALFSAGRVDEAARQLDAAMKEGAHIARADLRIAVASYRNSTDEDETIETSFPKALTLVDHDKKLVYLSLPKNACTLLKATFVMNGRHREDYLSRRTPIHAFCNELTARPLQRDLIMGPDYFRFVVLREPMHRVLSAYLDKFVRKRHAKDRNVRAQQMANTIRAAQALAGIPYDPERSISFEEFVRFLPTVGDGELNMHWMPQSRSVGTDLSIYNHVGKVERLKETLELLESRFGFVQMPVALRHIANFSEGASLRDPHRALPHELDEFEHAMPMPELFLTPALREILGQRYAADVALYASA